MVLQAKLKSSCPTPFEGGDAACLACTRDCSASVCDPKQRQLYCSTNGTDVSANNPATLCGENSDAAYP